MLVISNNCAGAAAYKYVLEQQYNNPFIWCRTDIIALAKEWSSINFRNIKLYNDRDDLLGKWHIDIDNKCSLRFSHHKFDPYATNVHITEPTDTQDAEIRYCKIWEYLVNKYFERLKRMPMNLYPIFLFYPDWEDTNDKLDTLKQHTDRIVVCPQTPNCGVIKNVRIHADELRSMFARYT